MMHWECSFMVEDDTFDWMWVACLWPDNEHSEQKWNTPSLCRGIHVQVGSGSAFTRYSQKNLEWRHLPEQFNCIFLHWRPVRGAIKINEIWIWIVSRDSQNTLSHSTWWSSIVILISLARVRHSCCFGCFSSDFASSIRNTFCRPKLDVPRANPLLLWFLRTNRVSIRNIGTIMNALNIEMLTTQGISIRYVLIARNELLASVRRIKLFIDSHLSIKISIKWDFVCNCDSDDEEKERINFDIANRTHSKLVTCSSYDLIGKKSKHTHCIWIN